MVIKLSGVQFGQKSYAWFQNWTSAQREFDLKSQVWLQTKIARPEANQMDARALIGQSPMVYCASKLMDISRVFWIIL